MEKRLRVKRKRPRLRVAVWVIGAALVTSVALWFFNESIYPVMETLARARAENLAIRAMNEAIIVSLSAEETYAQLLAATENGEKVYMLRADPISMNKLAYECAQTAQKKLSSVSEQGINISLGTLSGIAPLSGLGPNVRIRFTPSANVQASFTSTLEKSGINQTLYRVKIILTADIYIILPGKSKKFTVTTDAAVAESMIVGEVPQVFTNVEDLEDMTNLVPAEVP